VKLPFRLARGAWVALVILVAHAAVAWTFIQMRVRAPDLGPVFTMFLDDPRGESGDADDQPESVDSPDSPPARTDPPAGARAHEAQPSPKGESGTPQQPASRP
jgi:hypothetical protein